MSERIGLAAAIHALREELQQAMTADDEATLRFEASAVELTLQTEVTVSVAGKAGIRWWLVDAGVDGSRASVKVQTVRLTLLPRLSRGHGRSASVFLEGEDTR